MRNRDTACIGKDDFANETVRQKSTMIRFWEAIVYKRAQWNRKNTREAGNVPLRTV
jgi:hypothetical protein